MKTKADNVQNAVNMFNSAVCEECPWRVSGLQNWKTAEEHSRAMRNTVNSLLHWNDGIRRATTIYMEDSDLV